MARNSGKRAAAIVALIAAITALAGPSAASAASSPKSVAPVYADPVAYVAAPSVTFDLGASWAEEASWAEG